jgi:hypothetical protein
MNSLSDLSMSKLPVVPRFLVVFLVACVAFTGCSGSSAKLYPVKSKVTVDGADLKAGTVMFVPDTAKGNTNKASASSKIGADGTYSLLTEGKDGAPLGWYKVTIVTEMPGMAASKPDVAQPEPGKLPSVPSSGGGGVNAKYSSADTTPLSVEVVAQGGQYELKATR